MSTQVAKIENAKPVPGVIARYAPLVLFAVLWLDLIRQLSFQWEANEQYAYGWFVPIFAAALLWRRWQDRPMPEVREQGAGGRGQGAVIGGLVIVLLCLLLLPLRVIHEMNPDWPLITWPYATIVVLLTLYAFHLANPKAEGGNLKPEISSLRSHPSSLLSPWVRHFFFPICFILVAVQWPWRIEHGLTQGLMQIVASLTVEILGWIGIPALERGNLIELTNTTLGVDEACSGIRSFQSTLMAGLLMGELYRLRLLPRAALVLIGLSLAFFFNVARTFLLSYQAEKEGASAIDKWHDPAGFTIAIACFICLWAIAVLASKRFSSVSATNNQQSTINNQPPLSSAGSDPQLSTLNSQPSAGLRPLTSGLWRRYALAVGIWSLCVIGATESWYRYHELKAPVLVRWSVVFPENRPGFHRIQLPQKTLALLACDSANTAKWQEEGGAEWTVYFLRWDGMSRQSIFASRGHRPEVCLPASGLSQVASPQDDHLQAGLLKLPFQKSTYSWQDKPIYVFWFTWEDGEERRESPRASKAAERLVGPMEGRRQFGMQTLEILVTGYANAAEAEQAVRRRLPDLVRVEKPSGLASSLGRH